MPAMHTIIIERCRQSIGIKAHWHIEFKISFHLRCQGRWAYKSDGSRRMIDRIERRALQGIAKIDLHRATHQFFYYALLTGAAAIIGLHRLKHGLRAITNAQHLCCGLKIRCPAPL